MCRWCLKTLVAHWMLQASQPATAAALHRTNVNQLKTEMCHEHQDNLHINRAGYIYDYRKKHQQKSTGCDHVWVCVCVWVSAPCKCLDSMRHFKMCHYLKRKYDGDNKTKSYKHTHKTSYFTSTADNANPSQSLSYVCVCVCVIHTKNTLPALSLPFPLLVYAIFRLANFFFSVVHPFSSVSGCLSVCVCVLLSAVYSHLLTWASSSSTNCTHWL